MIHYHIRDFIKYILVNIDQFASKTPQKALDEAERKVRHHSFDIQKLRQRDFGTLPDRERPAREYLSRRFEQHKALAEEIDSSDGETVSDSDATVPINPQRTRSRSSSSSSSRSSSTQSSSSSRSSSSRHTWILNSDDVEE